MRSSLCHLRFTMAWHPRLSNTSSCGQSARARRTFRSLCTIGTGHVKMSTGTNMLLRLGAICGVSRSTKSRTASGAARFSLKSEVMVSLQGPWETFILVVLLMKPASLFARRFFLFPRASQKVSWNGLKTALRMIRGASPGEERNCTRSSFVRSCGNAGNSLRPSATAATRPGFWLRNTSSMQRKPSPLVSEVHVLRRLLRVLPGTWNKSAPLATNSLATQAWP
mmetsp:Transcript_17691/g.41530  ORF Transcript_17691/g.41530 Transcript_17691/m.41530 type:complete len:224 (-) Transcript_17691:1048-1719(-)